ncbi:MAG: phosphoribosylformylglycinamidine cyclo-ligase [Fimbriimonas ginsengisoli]|uniref:Phosphoribosylformylglycinamidine cyclo-ligase n=1 Tax=Fimbriimonas ginsengisoli TaxID=1005039 RepID=A0A931PTD8_FIMGI|nr:phosphoribosylformylglycinamidine cyclo-ligase [Fimbriimonas ginsengisoli]
MPDEPLTYAAAGVNIDESERALRAVVGGIQATYNENVLGGVGGFGGLYRANFSGLNEPVLVSSIDGVGTKTKVAAMVGRFSDLGRDIVHHCVNDILCQGARPLFFLDYFGTSRLSGLVFEEILGGMSAACTEVGMALIGGETAEMRGIYVDDEIDLVGAIVGVVDREKKLPRPKMMPGDVVVGLQSDGLHTNGFSLARRALFEVGGLSVRDEVPGLGGVTLGDELLRPHRCYFRALYPLLQEFEGIRAVAHITGGGIYDNLPRVMPPDIRAAIERRAWTPPPIFKLIQSIAEVPDQEMFRTFNMGIGMVLFLERDLASAVIQRLHMAGESASVIGELQKGAHDVQIL